MKRSLSRRVSTLVGGIAAVAAVAAALAFAAPAVAQVPPGSQAITIVGGPVANCPPGSSGALVPASLTINGVTVSGAGRCVPLSADAEGTYSVGGSAPLNFTAECDNVGGTVQGRSGVTVPTGTIVNGVAVAAPTVVETPNAAVTFPGGRTAVLNTRTATADSVTFRAIVFTGGPTVGQVTCGLPAYPLAVDNPVEALAQALPGGGSASTEDSGPGTGLLILGAAAIALVAMAQIAIGRRMRRGDAAV